MKNDPKTRESRLGKALPAILMAFSLAISCANPSASTEPDVGTPQGLSATLSTDGGTANLSWSPLSGASSYTIYRSAPDGSLKAIGTATTAAYADSSAVPGLIYSYCVTASQSGREGAKSASATLAFPFHGEYCNSAWTSTADGSARGPWSFRFSGIKDFSRYSQTTKDWEGIFSYSAVKREMLLDFLDASMHTEYYFTYSPVYVWENGDLSLDLYTFEPTADQAFPIGSFRKTIHYMSIQGSSSLGGNGTGLKSDESWSMSLNFKENGDFSNRRYENGNSDNYDEPSMFSSGTWKRDSKTGSLTLSNWNASQSRTTELKTLTLDGKTYYYFSHAIFVRK